LKYLREVYGYGVREERPRIYRVEGEVLGVQVVETGKLREEDGGVWLRDLRGGLKGEELQGIIERVRGIPKGMPVAAYLYRVLQANSLGFKELVEMSDITLMN
jgi:hypothetical protein